MTCFVLIEADFMAVNVNFFIVNVMGYCCLVFVND